MRRSPRTLPRLGWSLRSNSSWQRNSRGTPKRSSCRRNRRPPRGCTPLLPAPPNSSQSPVPHIRGSPCHRTRKRPGPRSDSRGSSPDKRTGSPTSSKCRHSRGRHHGHMPRRATMRHMHRLRLRQLRSHPRRQETCHPSPSLRRLRSRHRYPTSFPPHPSSFPRHPSSRPRHPSSRRPCQPRPRHLWSRRPSQTHPCQRSRPWSFPSCRLPHSLRRCR